MTDAFLYVFASAGTWSTEKQNLVAFREWQLVPRMLRDATSRSLEVRSRMLIASSDYDPNKV